MIIKFTKHLSFYLLFILIFCFSLQADPVFELPEKITFAGKTVPLDKYDVKNRIEKILNNLVVDRKNYMQSIIDAQNNFLPVVKNILGKFGIDPDFSYIIPVESDFNLRAISSSKASGPWQLMPATARMYGLRVDAQIDERNLLQSSSRASAEHLAHLMDIFNDDVFLVLAAFNNGEGNVASMLKTQNSKDFWECISNSETDLYVPKIIVFKIILSNPVKYGFREPQKIDNFTYEPYMLSLGPKDLPYTEICKILNINYREFHKSNPHLKHRSYKIEGHISKFTASEIMIPQGSKETLMWALKVKGYLTTDNIVSVDTIIGNSLKMDKYIVANSDNIESIAFRFGVSWKNIAEINDLEIVKTSNGIETAKIYPGQELIINR